MSRDLAGVAVVGTSPSNAGCTGSILGQGAEIPQDPTCLVAKKQKYKTEAVL